MVEQQGVEPLAEIIGEFEVECPGGRGGLPSASSSCGRRLEFAMQRIARDLHARNIVGGHLPDKFVVADRGRQRSLLAQSDRHKRKRREDQHDDYRHAQRSAQHRIGIGGALGTGGRIHQRCARNSFGGVNRQRNRSGPRKRGNCPVTGPRGAILGMQTKVAPRLLPRAGLADSCTGITQCNVCLEPRNVRSTAGGKFRAVCPRSLFPVVGCAALCRDYFSRMGCLEGAISRPSPGC